MECKVATSSQTWWWEEVREATSSSNNGWATRITNSRTINLEGSSSKCQCNSNSSSKCLATNSKTHLRCSRCSKLTSSSRRLHSKTQWLLSHHHKTQRLQWQLAVILQPPQSPMSSPPLPSHQRKLQSSRATHSQRRRMHQRPQQLLIPQLMLEESRSHWLAVAMTASRLRQRLREEQSEQDGMYDRGTGSWWKSACLKVYGLLSNGKEDVIEKMFWIRLGTL